MRKASSNDFWGAGSSRTESRCKPQPAAIPAATASSKTSGSLGTGAGNPVKPEGIVAGEGCQDPTPAGPLAAFDQW